MTINRSALKITKKLARSGHGYRREIEGLSSEGRISIDGTKRN